MHSRRRYDGGNRKWRWQLSKGRAFPRGVGGARAANDVRARDGGGWWHDHDAGVDGVEVKVEVRGLGVRGTAHARERAAPVGGLLGAGGGQRVSG